MSSDYIPVALQRQVRERAGHLCEYCRLPQAHQEATFHIDHVLPRSQAGETTPENLALACVSCSLRKGPRTKAIDPKTAQEVALFNPRRQEWGAHFQVTEDGWLVGLSSIGSATIDLLKMNRSVAVRRRREEARGG